MHFAQKSQHSGLDGKFKPNTINYLQEDVIFQDEHACFLAWKKPTLHLPLVQIKDVVLSILCGDKYLVAVDSKYKIFIYNMDTQQLVYSVENKVRINQVLYCKAMHCFIVCIYLFLLMTF